MVITPGVPLSPKRKAPVHMQTTGRSGTPATGRGGDLGDAFKRQRETRALRTEQAGRQVSLEKTGLVLAGACVVGLWAAGLQRRKTTSSRFFFSVSSIDQNISKWRPKILKGT